MYWFALISRLSKEWAVVSKDEAQQNRYFGLRGWLLLFYLAMVWSVFQNLIVAFASPHSELVEIFGGGNPAVFGGNLNVMRGIFLVYGVVAVPFLVLAPLRHPLTPKVWIGSTWISVIVFTAAVDMPGQINAMIGLISFVVVTASLMTWYFLHSKRVNVTFLNRVPVEEAAKQPQTLPGDPGWKYSRIGWIVAGIVGFLLLANLLQLITST